MDKKSLEVLEFPKVKEILAEFTSFSASRELALELQPLTSYETVVRLLRQSAEARLLLELEPGFTIGGVFDIRPLAAMAAREKILETLDLLQVQQVLIASRHLRGNLARVASDFPMLWEIAQGITELGQIERNISHCIGLTGEVLDTASPQLATVRRKLNDMKQQLMERLEAFMGSAKGQKVVQEAIITEREGRYVIPVKVEARREVKGIVHDVSNTGATVFVEPWATVELGNTLRELSREEQREIERILGSLSGEIGEHEGEIVQSITRIAELDLALAKARYARRFRASEPKVTEFDGNTSGGIIRLAEARHPLLADKAVPLSVEIGREFSALIITGPNTGGKTVALKTVGLLSLMVQSGLPIPALPESQMPVFDGIFADIGDEQSIEQTLSTFSWHMNNIARIINHASRKSLVLLDELGTSTDPAEGSALARSLLMYFLARGALIVATTHFSDLKAFAHTTRGMQNASLDFDPVTLAPTYHLVLGIPGGSNALATAARLGLPAEIIDNARSMLAKGTQEFETLLADLITEKHKMEDLSATLAQEKAEIEKRLSELENEFKRVKSEERRIVLETRDRVVSEAAELHKALHDAEADLRKEKSRERVAETRKVLAAIQKQLQGTTWKPAPGEEMAEEAAARIDVGNTVWVKEAGIHGTVLAVNEDKRQVEVQIGAAKIRLGLDGVEKTAPPEAKMSPHYTVIQRPSGRIVARELDLRGKRAEAIEMELDTYLNDAAVAGLGEVRIVHGYGTGAARKTVRERLAGHQLVKSFRPGERGEGGDGVTVVRL
ncbi:MAG: endonuclease MutS2 [Dehalococcoidales bacterium]|nr:endonuclease MutS2 [Dehalococcoidales bacterium]